MTNISDAGKRRILIVDDDSIVLMMLAHSLQHAGYAVSEAQSGEEALRMAVEQEPDLALLDVCMPGMTGLELARCLRSESVVPFMFLSTHGNIDVVKQATEHGALGYLMKPFDNAQLIPAIEAALARAGEIRQLRRTEANLTAALAAGRETSMAVGLLMAKCRTDRDTAFEMLRDYARSNRRKLNEVAQELLSAAELLNAFKTPASGQH